MKAREKKTGNLRKMFGHRFIAGSWSAFAAVIVIAIAVIANLIAGSLPVTSTQIDLTGNSMYSLSDQTKRIAASLDRDVTLYLLATSGNEDSTIVRFLNNYAALSDHINVETVDPGLQPTFLKGYELETSRLYQNSVIVDSNGRYRLDHAVSKRQKIILSAFGMSDEDIRRLSVKIGNLLASGDALPMETDSNEEEDDDGTHEIDIID